uniref:OTU domain-containing protein n=1 Tax=Globodera rostochiensis TaxID=31243 RepID=A0A914HPW7_GLORO
MEEINKLGQSGGENGDDMRTILLSRPVQMNVTCVALPAGEGQRNVHKFDYGFKEHQRIQINNNDKFCLFYAMAAAKNYLEMHKDTAESVKLELKTFDEIFGEGWWDKGEAEDLKAPPSTNFGQNVHHQIDRQNTQIGQIEPNSTDQNPPLTGSNHSDNAKNGEQQNEIIITKNEKSGISASDDIFATDEDYVLRSVHVFLCRMLSSSLQYQQILKVYINDAAT